MKDKHMPFDGLDAHVKQVLTRVSSQKDLLWILMTTSCSVVLTNSKYYLIKTSTQQRFAAYEGVVG